MTLERPPGQRFGGVPARSGALMVGVLVLAGFVGASVARAAGSPDVQCVNQTLSVPVTRDVIVPAGASCVLGAGVSVGRDVLVGKGGVLTDRGATVGRDIRVSQPQGIGVGAGAGGQPGNVGRDVQIDGLGGGGPGRGGESYVCNTTIGRDLVVQNAASSAAAVVVGDTRTDCGAGANQVGRDLRAQNNSSPLDVSNNQAGHDAVCQGNTGLFGAGNTAQHNNGCNYANPAPAFAITDLQPLPASFEQGSITSGYDTFANAINQSGQVLGESKLQIYPLRGYGQLWDHGQTTTLPLPAGARAVRGLGLNAAGDAVGYAVTNDGLHAVAYHAGQPTLRPELSGDIQSVAFSVNGSGQAVGYSQPVSGFGQRPDGAHAVIWNAGTPTALGTLPGDSESVAYAINDAGAAVGYSQSYGGEQHAVLFAPPSGGSGTSGSGGGTGSGCPASGCPGSGCTGTSCTGGGTGTGGSGSGTSGGSGSGSVTPLGMLPGDLDSAAFAIRSDGVAVGYSAGTSGFHAVQFANGGVQALSPPGGAVNTQALAINKQRWAVGTGDDGDGYHQHAILWLNGTGVSLEALLPAGSGWTLQTATALNDHGQIVGNGTIGGQRHAFLFAPTRQLTAGELLYDAGSGNLPTDPKPAVASGAPDTIPVHYDYQALAGPDGHSDAPDPAWLQPVVDQFAKHGISLAIEPQHTAIPERTVTSFASPGFNPAYRLDPVHTGPDAIDFFTLKSRYFTETQAHTHYALFAYYPLCDSTPHCQGPPGTPPWPVGTSGISELAGFNSMVSLGDFHYNKGFGPGLYSEGTTFMHELGHSLGLHHGGGLNIVPYSCGNYAVICRTGTAEDIPNFKPNYLSVMNYRYQFTGIKAADTVGWNVADPALTRLDYSEQVLPAGGPTPGYLNEAGGLDEASGLGSGTADLFSYVPGSCPIPSLVWAATTGPVDWDGDGNTTGTGISADLNAVDHTCGSQHTTLIGHNDWADIAYFLHNSPLLTGTWPTPTITSVSWTCDGPYRSTPYPFVRISGTNLIAVNQIDFNGTTDRDNNAVLSPLDASIYLHIPQGATNGPLTVRTPGGTSAQSPTSFDPNSPAICDFNPASGPLGTSVTITGPNIYSSSTQVTFTPSAPTTNTTVTPTLTSAGSVTAVVPEGAATGPITVTTPAGSAISSQPFTVTG